MDSYIEQITALANRRKDDRPLFIAIDGHSAAGKSTAAKKASASLERSVLIHTDDFYRVMEDARFKLTAREGYERLYDWRRLGREVLEPLSRNEPAEFNVYDWHSNKLGDLKRIEPADYVIVEGCYSARPELSSFFDIVVLVETPPEERKRRQAERNDASQDWLNRWDAAERFYLETTLLARRADVVVYTDSST